VAKVARDRSHRILPGDRAGARSELGDLLRLVADAIEFEPDAIALAVLRSLATGCCSAMNVRLSRSRRVS
jgi:hypothetical protein